MIYIYTSLGRANTEFIYLGCSQNEVGIMYCQCMINVELNTDRVIKEAEVRGYCVSCLYLQSSASTEKTSTVIILGTTT